VKALALNTTGGEQSWPALEDAGKPTSQSAAEMVAVWRGERDDVHGAAVVIATAAVALHAAGRAVDAMESVAQARALWSARVTTPPPAQ
jgi:anthranilate phosphoribosyltransferase